MNLEWYEHTAKPVGKPVIQLGSFGAEVKGAQYNALSFTIMPLSRIFAQYRPKWAKGEYVLEVNNQYIFSGSLDECKAEAQKRTDRFMNELAGKWDKSLVEVEID